MRRTVVAALSALALICIACQSATVLSDGRVLLFMGGRTAVFDPSTGTVSVAPGSGTMRIAHTATLLDDGRVLLAGGVTNDAQGQSVATVSADLYDPAARTIAATGSLGAPRALHAAARLADGRVLISGGCEVCDMEKPESFKMSATAELYDPTAGTFSPGPAETPRFFHTATTLQDGRVLLVAGMDMAGPITAAETFDPATDTFTTAPGTSASRTLHTATLLDDGRVLVVGGVERAQAGSDGTGTPLTTAELFDPVTGMFSPTGSTAVGHAAHTATLLRDGRVLIAGGMDAQNQAVGTAELYDPKTGTFSPTGQMAIPLALHTASLLPDGHVLLWGLDAAAASDPTADPFALVEVYDPEAGTFAVLER
jgi:hypothetical protein